MELDRDTAGATAGFESIPEVLLPVQLESASRFDLALGERRLLCAMLLDAAACFCKHRNAHDNNGRKLFREAQSWIRSQEDQSPFSFAAVCSVLGLNAHRLRVSLLESVYGSPPVDASRRARERVPRQSRPLDGSRAARNCVSRLGSYREAQGERPSPLARAVPG
jgi:hypothetical protein